MHICENCDQIIDVANLKEVAQLRPAKDYVTLFENCPEINDWSEVYGVAIPVNQKNEDIILIGRRNNFYMLAKVIDDGVANVITDLVRVFRGETEKMHQFVSQLSKGIPKKVFINKPRIEKILNDLSDDWNIEGEEVVGGLQTSFGWVFLFEHPDKSYYVERYYPEDEHPGGLPGNLDQCFERRQPAEGGDRQSVSYHAQGPVDGRTDPRDRCRRQIRCFSNSECHGPGRLRHRTGLLGAGGGLFDVGPHPCALKGKIDRGVRPRPGQ